MTQHTGYSEEHARSIGETPPLDAWPNQFRQRDYVLKIVVPEFTCVCPKTGQPDFGTVTIEYIPDETCVELKSLKLYMQAYREMGIFHENIANKVLDDFVTACSPRKARVTMRFNPRGGIYTTVTAEYPYSDPGTGELPVSASEPFHADHPEG